MVYFFKMPKTASGYIKRLMKRAGLAGPGGGYPVTVLPHVGLKPSIVHSFQRKGPLFVFVRHPLTRLYSAYHWIKDVDNGNNHRAQNRLVWRAGSFNEFVLSLEDTKSCFCPHFMPMTKWVDPRRLDWWGRYENLEQDSEIMNARYGWNLPIKADRRADKEKTGAYSDKRIVTVEGVLPHYSSEALDFAQKFFRADFEHFQYETL